MLRIEFAGISGEVQMFCEHEQEALLCIKQPYQVGDKLIIRCDDGARLWTRMDAAMPACEAAFDLQKTVIVHTFLWVATPYAGCDWNACRRATTLPRSRL